MAYQYTIGFYEESSTIHLVEGIQAFGTASSDTYDYYSFDILDEDSNYEITVTSSVGNPDLVISLNASNKFPTPEFNDYISEKEFSTDSIVVD
jgi:hypothetical protein